MTIGHVHGDVINVAGNLTLNKNSSHEQFLTGLRALQQEVDSLKNLSSEQEAQVKAEIASAIEASKDANASKSYIAAKLESVKSTLDSVNDTVEGASNLASTLGTVASWVVKTAKFFI